MSSTILPFQNKLSSNYSKKASFKNSVCVSHNQYIRKMGKGLACIEIEYFLKYLALTEAELSEVETLFSTHELDSYIAWKAPIDFKSFDYHKPITWSKENYSILTGDTGASSKERRFNLSFSLKMYLSAAILADFTSYFGGLQLFDDSAELSIESYTHGYLQAFDNDILPYTPNGLNYDALLFDGQTFGKSIVVENEGTWTINNYGGVEFFPLPSLTTDPTPLQYVVWDRWFRKSNYATLSFNLQTIKEFPFALNPIWLDNSIDFLWVMERYALKIIDKVTTAITSVPTEYNAHFCYANGFIYVRHYDKITKRDLTGTVVATLTLAEPSDGFIRFDKNATLYATVGTYQLLQTDLDLSYANYYRLPVVTFADFKGLYVEDNTIYIHANPSTTDYRTFLIVATITNEVMTSSYSQNFVWVEKNSFGFNSGSDTYFVFNRNDSAITSFSFGQYTSTIGTSEANTNTISYSASTTVPNMSNFVAKLAIPDYTSILTHLGITPTKKTVHLIYKNPDTFKVVKYNYETDISSTFPVEGNNPTNPSIDVINNTKTWLVTSTHGYII